MKKEMNRYDWIATGLCLYGVYLVVQAFLGLVGLVSQNVVASSHVPGAGGFFARTVQAGLVTLVVQSFIGSCLVLASTAFTNVLQRREQRLEQTGV